MKSLVEKLQSRSMVKKERGASALEYIVLAAVIVIAVVAGAILLGGEGGKGGPIKKTFEDISESISGGTGGE